MGRWFPAHIAILGVGEFGADGLIGRATGAAA